MIQPWLQASWQRLLALGERLPHALLFAGPSGLGKRQFAEAMAARLLCEQPGADGLACGHCQACQWQRADTHPDFFVLMPAAEAARLDGAAESEVGGAPGVGGEKDGERSDTGKKLSQQIVIEQVRALQEALSLTAHQGGRRVVIIEPAEAMNAVTANALLKLLEEPPAGCVFLLLSTTPRQLLPTIRSRCQHWPFGRPSSADLAQWTAGASSARLALLALSGGLPLAAERMEAVGMENMLERFVRDLGKLRSDDCVRLAGEWETWLKSKDAQKAAFELPQLIDWMQCWVSDLLILRLGGPVRFFPQQGELLARLAAGAGIAALSGCYNALLQLRKLSRHPLNLRLLLEDMLLRYAAALAAVR